jgi:hypothetical protein
VEVPQVVHNLTVAEVVPSTLVAAVVVLEAQVHQVIVHTMVVKVV